MSDGELMGAWVVRIGVRESGRRRQILPLIVGKREIVQWHAAHMHGVLGLWVLHRGDETARLEGVGEAAQ